MVDKWQPCDILTFDTGAFGQEAGLMLNPGFRLVSQTFTLAHCRFVKKEELMLKVRFQAGP